MGWTPRGAEPGRARSGSPPVLYFHESAITAPASNVYLEFGYRVVKVSRPGYGHTDVGPLPPRACAPLIDEARAMLGIDSFTAVIGTSFGGPRPSSTPGATRPGPAR